MLSACRLPPGVVGPTSLKLGSPATTSPATVLPFTCSANGPWALPAGLSEACPPVLSGEATPARFGSQVYRVSVAGPEGWAGEATCEQESIPRDGDGLCPENTRCERSPEQCAWDRAGLWGGPLGGPRGRGMAWGNPGGSGPKRDGLMGEDELSWDLGQVSGPLRASGMNPGDHQDPGLLLCSWRAAQSLFGSSRPQHPREGEGCLVRPWPGVGGPSVRAAPRQGGSGRQDTHVLTLPGAAQTPEPREIFILKPEQRGRKHGPTEVHTGERAFPHLLSLEEGGWARPGLGGEAARVSNSSQSPCPSPETQNTGVNAGLGRAVPAWPEDGPVLAPSGGGGQRGVGPAMARPARMVWTPPGQARGDVGPMGGGPRSRAHSGAVLWTCQSLGAGLSLATSSSLPHPQQWGPAGSAANVSCSPSPPSQAMGRACNRPRLPAPHPSPPCCPSSRWLPGEALGCPDTVPRGSGLPHSPDPGVAGSSDRAGQTSPRLAVEPTWAGQGQAGVSE